MSIVASLLLGVLCLCVPTGRAHAAQDAITYRGWLSDPDSSLTPQGVLKREWTPFSGVLARGYTAATTWVRLEVDPAAAGPGSLPGDHRLVLQVVPAHLDEVAVFRADRPDAPPVLLGDRQFRDPQGGSTVDEVVYADVRTPFTLLLRVRSESNHSLHAQVLRWDAARAFDAWRVNLWVGYAVFTAMVIVWALSVGLSRRDATSWLFVAQQLCALFVGASLIGVLNQLDVLLPPAVIDLSGSLAIQLLVITTLAFHARILAQLGARESDVKRVQFAAWVALAALLMISLGWRRSGLLLGQTTILAGNLLSLSAAWRVRPEGAASEAHSIIGGKPYLVGMYVFMVLNMLPQWLRVVGLASAGLWSLGGYFVYSVTGSLLLGNLLLYRMRHERERNRRAELAYQQSQQEVAEQRARAGQQSELVAMLAHELKTPLAVVNLALGADDPRGELTRRAVRAVANMRHVIDRCDQAARMDDAMVRRESSPQLRRLALQDVLLEVVDAELEADRVDISEPADLPPCIGDPQMLRLICANLIENALKYSPPESTVQVDLARQIANDRAGLMLTVSNVVGAAGRPDPEQVFDKFYRSANARASAGSGLGLYLSRRTAERMGAELSVDLSDAGRVRFRLWVPC